MTGAVSGMRDVNVEAEFGKAAPVIVSSTTGRTADRIMDGPVYVSRKIYAS